MAGYASTKKDNVRQGMNGNGIRGEILRCAQDDSTGRSIRLANPQSAIRNPQSP
jgi:hypothetical protein